MSLAHRVTASRLTIAALLVLLLAGFPTRAEPPAEQEPAAADPRTVPREANISEEVRVRLAEVQILVTDRDGRPITDLRTDEVVVREEGKSRKVAFLEPFATMRSQIQSAPGASPAVDAVNPAVAGSEPPRVEIPAPAAARWVVLLFDAFNSRLQERKRWLKASHDWVKNEMRPDDQVGAFVIKLGGEIEQLVGFSGRKDALLSALQNENLLDGVPPYDSTLELRRLMGDLTTCLNSREIPNCTRTAAQAPVFEWYTRGVQTFSAMRRLSGVLASIPGRKSVLLMSAGAVSDPGRMAGTAILGAYGADRVPTSNAMAMFDRDLNPQMLEMLRVANNADVTFFTFDTRPSSLREVSSDAENADALSERRAGDPYADIFDMTRGGLTTIALRTGGRALHGPKIEENLPIAARAIEGIYTIGFYRDPRAGRLPRFKLEVKRRGARVSFPDRYDSQRDQARTVPIEIAVTGTRPVDEGTLLPLKVQLSAANLTFRRDEKQHLASVAMYAEAITPEGRRAASIFEQVDVSLSAAQLDDTESLRFSHVLGLVLDPGSYRLRVRVTDAEFQHVADRSIDVTLHPGGKVSAGLADVPASSAAGSEP